MATLFKQTVDCVTGSLTNPHTQQSFLAVAGASITLGLTLGVILSADRSQPPKIIESPLKAVRASKDSPVLPLDFLPGARDVSTPYGSIRVYEWGPEDGRKVLLVHGISTPCLALGGLGHSLVDRGCRVMIFDLFGRGYSDTPGDIDQDDRLFTTQILLVLASSQLSWTGSSSGQFSLIGYSLGGGIAAAFASYFPDLLSSLILITPAGLLRENHINWQSHVLLMAKGWIPDNVINNLVRRRLKAGPLAKPVEAKDTQNGSDNKEAVGVEAALTQELTTSPEQVLSRAYPSLRNPEVVGWQIENHNGFIPAFISSMRYGPIPQKTQLELWQRLGSLLSQRKQEGNATGLAHDKVLVLLGEKDNIIIKDDTAEDATRALEGNLKVKAYDIGHELPTVKYEELADELMDLWK